ncbi:hypothetical protein J3R83DRAFT_12400 [Lanmaoa asiatica]|nr:hypothetical protein J3R83DRAFT_12400 [Lanmaoa asiatica]
MSEFPRFATGPEQPIFPDAWKRAIYRRAPNNFLVQVLPPEKHGNSYSYGFRVSSPKDDNASTTTCSTSFCRSIASINEYDIWRKWDDCLWFQDTLEMEYSRAAREKRNRLAAGKGVKKNGVYIHSDQAASWESLPFGPNPDDIARDIHGYIPKLSKKGTFFRASQEVVDHRYEELQMMMQALLQDDLPTLVKEIKATSTFTDFFAVWRRDIDLLQKAVCAKKQPTAGRLRPSISTSILSAFPISPSSPSSLSVKSLSPTKGKAPERAQIPSRTTTHSDSSSSEDSVNPPRQSRSMDQEQDILSMRSRASSSGSHSSSSLPSTPVKILQQLPPTSRQPVIASQELPIRFGHNPHVLGGERGSSVLESLPEDRELPSPTKSDLDAVGSRKRSGSTASRVNRNARVYAPPTFNSPQSFEPSCKLCYSFSTTIPPARSLSRYSIALLHSATIRATVYLDELDVDYCLPSPTPEPRSHPRASVSSLASLMSNSSVDAVIPRSERPSRSLANNAQRPPSLPEESWREYEPWSEDDSQSEDILDAYFHDLIGPHTQTPDDYPETPTMDETVYRFPQKQPITTISSYSLYSDRRSSLTTSISSGSTSSSGNLTTLSIKAMHEDNIVMLRLPRDVAIDELRRKIYDKFIQTGKSTISESFAVALLEQIPVGNVESGRPRGGSFSSLGSAYTTGVALHFISSQDEWDDVVATHNGKMLLRIIGSRE